MSEEKIKNDTLRITKKYLVRIPLVLILGVIAGMIVKVILGKPVTSVFNAEMGGAMVAILLLMIYNYLEEISRSRLKNESK